MRRRLLRQARRLGVIAIGFLVLAIGLVLAALPMIPGGMLGILLGLTILSTELEWARRLRIKVLATGGRFASRLFRRSHKDETRSQSSLPAERPGSSGKGAVLAATPRAIAKATGILSRGGLVAFPTETVYGLGAVASDSQAVARIFAAKGRPADNPLIVHVASLDMLESIAYEVPDVARRLIEAFWPGPLTLVLRRSSRLPPIVSAGLDTVAVRVPADPVALDLIRCTGQPIAAPSANRSGRPSPTSAQHVLRDLGDAVDLILDGGPTDVGVESTVLDVTGLPPVLLRPGGVSKEELERVVGPVRLYRPDGGPPRSPGLKHRHYAPDCRVMLVEPSEWRDVLPRVQEMDQCIGILCRSLHGPDGVPAAYFRRVAGDEAEYARALFAGFREAEAAGVELLLVEAVAETGVGLAIMDRLRRAARPEAPEGKPAEDSCDALDTKCR